MTGSRPRLEDGVLWLDGAPRLLLAGEYPYYRDAPRLWAPKLRALRLAGLEIVSFYIPWRHHEIAAADGRGVTVFAGDGNRDLVGFLQRIWDAGLFALPKPGPFVHAELPFGGLPDRVSPSLDPRRCAALSAAGEPLQSQRLALPSAQDPAFLADAGAWLRSVGAILRPQLYPDGPIVAVQIGNEGHYGETALPVDALDYSPCGIEAFERSTPAAEPPRGWRAPGGAGDLLPYLTWGAWIAQALLDGLENLADQLGMDVPVLANYSPPARAGDRPAGRYDAWLVRGATARRSPVNYAYTNWTGDLVRDDEALVNYVLAAKRRRGPNLEENWSLRWVDPGCACACVPIYHALLGLACGATGLDVYTACATGQWGEHLVIDRNYLRETAGDPAVLDPPYGDAAPIGVAGEAAASLAPLAVLTHFLAGVGPALMQTRPEPGLTFCTYAPYAAIGAWDPPVGSRVAGHPLPPSAAATLVPFVRHCLRHNLPFAVTDLDRLPAGPLVVASGFFMAAAVQQHLAAHVQQGGALLALGELPILDDYFRPCRILADAVGAVRTPTGRFGRVTVAALDQAIDDLIDGWRAGLQGIRPPPDGHDPLEFQRVTPGADDWFAFLFSRADEVQRITTRLGGDTLTVDLAPRGCAVVRVADGRLVACYVKGLNEQTGAAVPIAVRIGPDKLVSSHPCDVSIIRRGDGFDLRTQGGPPSNRVIVEEAMS